MPAMRSLSALILAAACLVAACSPTYNWRQYASPDASYVTMFPDKPATHTRPVSLGAMPLELTMTAAEVDGVVFAVATGEVSDAGKAAAAVDAMKTAMLRNIAAKVTAEKRLPGPMLDIEAAGVRNGQPMRLVGHFEARGKRVYQVIVLGPTRQVVDEQVEQFLTSFKPQTATRASA